MFEQAFKNIDDVLRKEAGCTTELDYTEQTSWLLFLKYLDGLEQDKADEAALEGESSIITTQRPATTYATSSIRSSSPTFTAGRKGPEPYSPVSKNNLYQVASFTPSAQL